MALPVQAPRRAEDRSHLWVTFEKGGKVVGRVVTADGRVRWGPSVGIEFAYPVPGVETREELFSRGRRGPRLLLVEGLSGEIAAGWSGRLSVEDLDAWGIVRGGRGRRWIALSRGMEGRLEYRGFRISFGFGAAPEMGAEAPRIKVPLRFRRPPLARDEWPFTVLAWGLYSALLFLALHLAGRPLPLAPHPEAVAQRFARLIYEAPQAPSRARTELLQRREETEPAPEAEPVPPEPAKSEPAKPEPTPEPKPAESPKPEPAKAEAPKAKAETPPAPRPEAAPKPEGGGGPTPEQVARRREQLRESVAKKGLLGLLGGRGNTSTAKARGSILEGRGAAEDLDRVLEKVEGLRAAPAGGGGGTGQGLGVAGVPEGPGEDALRAAAASGRTVELEERQEEVVETVEEQPLDELTLREAVAAIHRTVGTYLGGIRYLYNRELRKKPELEGKLTVSMTISPDGVVTECRLVESTLGHPPLEEAVLDRVRKWKFPPVAPRPVTVTYPFVFFPSM